jgi:hypothetical protein
MNRRGEFSKMPLYHKEIEPGATVNGKTVKGWHTVCTIPVAWRGGKPVYEIKVVFTDGSYEYALRIQE